MEKSYFTILVILIGVNILICRAFNYDEIINVDKAIEFYNNIPGLSWTAGRNRFAKTIKLSKIKSKFGLILKPKKTQRDDFSSQNDDEKEIDDLPKNYDTRTAFPYCTTISSIKDQSNCGSCWAISVAATFSDRLCIHSYGKINFNMSADQLLACDEESNGCKSGHLDTAWEYIAKSGLVTGGDYGSNEGCRPYSIPPNPSSFARLAKTPICTETACPESFAVETESIAHIESNEYKIRKEIFQNGPITTGLKVHLSLEFYEKGIYSRPFIDSPLGNHAVRVIGWGEENGTKYWLVANSWGKTWGEDGTFRILRGTNECEFEENMIAGLPAIN